MRLYHPDKIGESTPSDLAHARFQAITAAYDTLRKKNSAPHDPLGPSSSASPTVRYQTTAAYNAMRRKRQELYNSGPVDDSRKDKLIIFGVVMVCIRIYLSCQRSLIFRPSLLCWYKPRLCEERCLSETLSRHRQAVQNTQSIRREEDRLSQDHTQNSDTS